MKKINKKFLFTAQTVTASRALEASNKISLLIAKLGKNHNIGKNLIKPSISAFVKTVLEKDDKGVKAMPHNNDTVKKRINEISRDCEIQHVEKLKSRNFSIQIDESTVRDSEALLLAYLRL